MRLGSAVTLSALVAGTSALNIPQFDEMISPVLSSFSKYTDYSGPKGVWPVPAPIPPETISDPPYWLADIAHQGYAAFNPNASTYQVFRNVKDFGAKGRHTPYFLSVPPLSHIQVMVSRTTPRQSTRLLVVEIGSGRLPVWRMTR
jgi:hypothetical protein